MYELLLLAKIVLSISKTMTAIYNKATAIGEQFKDVLFMIYVLGMITLVFVLLMEVKLEYQIDVLPGMDIPVDEWYAALFKS